jgi:ABC-type oligopeptide transport system substrate-binding subunit
MKKITLLFIILLLAAAPVRAEELYGLAMHGTPKYGPEATHLGYANPDAPKGGTLRQNAPLGTFDTLNPYSIKGNAAQGLAGVYDRLMARVWDEPFTLYPLIAEKVGVPADRSGIIFHLNPKARFHDGSPVTADDVLFSFETLRDHGRPNMRRIYKLVTMAEKTGERTVKFAFGPGFDRETVMIIAMMPVLSKKWWQGRDFDATTLEVPLLNGPYKIASVDPGRRIVYERVPDYWAKDLLVNRGHNNFDRLVYDYYRDDTVAFESFKAGDLDLRREFDAGKWASAYDFPAVKNGEVITESLPHGRPERVRAFIMNSRRAPFDDPRVRSALQYALDFKWVNDNLFHGKYKRIGSFFPNSELAATNTPDEKQLAALEPFREKLRPEIFGPAWEPPAGGGQREGLKKADELLKQAGWVVQDGIRMKDGKPFTFEIILSAPEDEKIALAFLRSLKRLGIAANIRMLDSAAFIGRLNDYDYDMVLYYWLNSLSPGTEQMLYWSCEAAKQPARFNYAGICDPAVDALAGSIAAATSREDLVARARALDRVLTWGEYMIPLYYVGQDFAAYRKYVHHPATIPLYGMVLETWWAEKTGDGPK